MAKLEDVLGALRAGKKIRRANWNGDGGVTRAVNNVLNEAGGLFFFSGTDMLADDWEVVQTVEDCEKRVVEAAEAWERTHSGPGILRIAIAIDDELHNAVRALKKARG